MTASQTASSTETPAHHSLLADSQGILIGSALASYGILMLTSMGLATGQTAGLAVLISYVTGWSFGPVFFIINLPFYWFGYVRLGLAFTIKTFIAVALMSIFAKFLPTQIIFQRIAPWTGAILFGMLTGSALLALFRHGSSLGGVGIMALYIQEKSGFRAGYVQLIFDLCIFVAALFILPLDKVVWSLLGAMILNLIIAINHRRDWYVAR